MYQRVFRGREAVFHLLLLIAGFWLPQGTFLIMALTHQGYGTWFWYSALASLGVTLFFICFLWIWGWGTKTKLFHFEREQRTGKLVVTSGKLLVGDPLDLSQDKPLLKLAVDPGQYPLDVLLRVTPLIGNMSTARGESSRRASLKLSSEQADARKLLAELDAESGVVAFVDEEVWNQNFIKERQVYLGKFHGPGYRALAEKVCQHLLLDFVDKGDYAQITKAVNTFLLEAIYELLGPEHQQQFSYREYSTLIDIDDQLAENTVMNYRYADMSMAPDGSNILVIDFHSGNLTGLYRGSRLVGLELEKVRPY